MKKILLVPVAFIFTLACIAQSDLYYIDVTILNGVQNGKAFLRYWGDNGPFMDSAIITNGRFTLKGSSPPQLAIAKIYLQDNKGAGYKNSCEAWLEPGKTYIVADKFLMNAVYNGSAMQLQFSELSSNLIPVKKKNAELDEAYEKAEAEKDAVLKDRLLNEDYPALFREKQKILNSFIRKYPASLISAYKFDEFAGDEEMDLALVVPVYELLAKEIKQHPRVIKTAQRIENNKLTAPGMEAIEFTQGDTTGTQISLSSFRGKYLLIDFWAGWCVPCRAENPNLKKLYQRYRTSGFEILGVSLDGERKRWTNAIVSDGLTWPQVSDLQIFDNKVAKLYGIASIPQNILIDPAGKIIAKNLRGSKLENKLSEIFK
jgi:peroxiredoxin